MHVQGVAWAGEADVTRVEVSPMAAKAGKPRNSAKIMHATPGALWSHKFKAPKSGDYIILARATDSKAALSHRLQLGILAVI